MSIARALAILGAGASGYQGGQEQARQRSRQEEDDAFRREQRDRQRTDWQRSDEKYAREKADMEAERKNMAPVEGNPVFPTGDDEGNAMPMTPDMQRFTVAGTPGVLDAAGVAAQNTPESRIRRAAAGAPDPARAAALNSQANASETGSLQLDQAKQTAVQQAWKRKAGAMIVGSQSWDAATKFMTESKADGLDGTTKWEWEESPDKKTVMLFSVDKDGKRSKGQPFENNDMGRMKLFTLLDTSTPIEAKMKDQLAEDNRVRDDSRSDKAEERRGKHEDRMFEQAQRQTAAAERAAAARAAGAGRASGAGGDAPVWDDKASAFLRQKFTVTDPATGQTMVDGAGLDFGKSLALAQSRRNGGDLDRSIGYAFDADSKLRAAATDPKGQYDPAKHNLLRQMAMKALQAPRAEQPGPGAPAAAPGAAPGGAPAAPPARAVPQPRMQAAAAPGAAPGGDPLQGLSRQQVREKRGQIAAEIKRWESDPNAKARIDELRTLLERIDNGQY